MSIKKSIFITLILFFIAIFSFYSFSKINLAEAAACQNHSLSGYAWSSNIGWISFSCKNNNPSVNYGVDVDSAGLLSGYAWSSNIGWISFNTGDLNSCPSGACSATFNKTTGEVSGWARAKAFGGGWDGWIKLKGPNYGVSVTNCNWNGYAWGGDDTIQEAVVGWVHFKGAGYGVVGNGNACTLVTQSDLTISQNPSLNTGSLIDGNIVTFKATIKNIGDKNVSAVFKNHFQIDLNNDGNVDYDLTPDPNINSLNINEEKVITSGNWTVQGGTHRVIICTDSNLDINESNENNNCGSNVINILSIPIITFNTNKPKIKKGESATLSWDVLNVDDDDCSASDSGNPQKFTDDKPKNGNEVITPLVSTTYTLTCTNAAGTDSKSVTELVEIIPGPGEI